MTGAWPGDERVVAVRQEGPRGPSASDRRDIVVLGAGVGCWHTLAARTFDGVARRLVAIEQRPDGIHIIYAGEQGARVTLVLVLVAVDRGYELRDRLTELP